MASDMAADFEICRFNDKRVPAIIQDVPAHCQWGFGAC